MSPNWPASTVGYPRQDPRRARLTYIPANLDPRTLVGVLHRLGLMVPTSLSAAASSGQSLRASGHRYSVKGDRRGALQGERHDWRRFRVKTAKIVGLTCIKG